MRQYVLDKVNEYGLSRRFHNVLSNFFELYASIILTSTLVLGINYFVIITRPLHPIPVRKRCSSSNHVL